MFNNLWFKNNLFGKAVYQEHKTNIRCNKEILNPK